MRASVRQWISHRFFRACILFIALVATSCTSTDFASTPRIEAPEDSRLLATLWSQSAEAAASYLQAFAVARHTLDNTLAGPAPEKPWAIITDIDETVLDNSGYQAWQIWNRQKYSRAAWKLWTSRAEAPATPGASNFLNYAAGRGVVVFYVTNRDVDETDATVINLRRAGFPFATTNHLFTERAVKSKEERRLEIMQRYNVCMLLGDNLADFSLLFDSATMEARNDSVITNATRFGSNWIVFPNPMYGSWESARSVTNQNSFNASDRLRGPRSLP